mgnify:CR=1 FL=1
MIANFICCLNKVNRIAQIFEERNYDAQCLFVTFDRKMSTSNLQMSDFLIAKRQ